MTQWPTAQISINHDAHGEIHLAGVIPQFSATTVSQARQAGLELMTTYAAWFGRDLTAICSDPDGVWTIKVSKDGKATDATITRKTRLLRKK